MSSADSRTTSSSRLSQFGIYRSIDARTEEFLRLSRKRQIRQGCACAAVSTAITVTIVIVILLIYEYAIVIESSVVQKIRNNKHINETNDNPVADKLDRSFFGFDQDYYERMPLLVNAMQEIGYVDQAVDTTTITKPKARYILANTSKSTTSTLKYRTNSIRRTSPRPFYFEYKSPTPTPFSKTYTSRSWIDSYRNAQRLNNLQQVIQYLEKTINAKFGDLYALPTSTIAFSGVYVEPTISQPKPTSPTLDLISQASSYVEKYKSNHQSPDPLYSYKPDSPGDVNLLADGFFRFSPVPTPSILKDKYATNIPMFRPITHRKRKCIGIRCLETAESRLINSQEVNDVKSIESTSQDKPKTFSVMLNLFPLKTNNYEHGSLETTQMPVNKIYITTSRPTVQFRRKSTTPIRRTMTHITRPRTLPSRKIFKSSEFISGERIKPAIIEPKMIVHVNLYPAPEIKDQVTTESNNIHTTTTTPPRLFTQIPILTSTQVEDYHLGSSGIIPPEARLTPAPPPPILINVPTLPTPSNMIPFFDITSGSTEHSFKATNPPEILKFGHEDAKIPDHYKQIVQMEEISSTSAQPQITRRNSKGNINSNEEYDAESRTVISKLKNNEVESTTEYETTERSEKNEASSIVKTYVPQINGHYRSVNQNSRNINTWLNEYTQDNRKRRLEMSVTGFRKTTYVPQYVEIKRNSTRNSSDKENEEK